MEYIALCYFCLRKKHPRKNYEIADHIVNSEVVEACYIGAHYRRR